MPNDAVAPEQPLPDTAAQSRRRANRVRAIASEIGMDAVCRRHPVANPTRELFFSSY